MIKVEINKVLNKKKRIKILTFLYSISNEVCFSAIHNYKIDEETGNEIINEYKKRCIEKHHELKVWYDNKEPFLLKSLKKLKIKTEDEFVDYQNQIFHSDIFCFLSIISLNTVTFNEDNHLICDTFPHSGLWITHCFFHDSTTGVFHIC